MLRIYNKILRYLRFYLYKNNILLTRTNVTLSVFEFRLNKVFSVHALKIKNVLPLSIEPITFGASTYMDVASAFSAMLFYLKMIKKLLGSMNI